MSQYVKEQDEKINDVNDILSVNNDLIQNGSINIEICEQKNEENKKKILIGAGAGTIAGLLASGSFAIAPLSGLLFGYLGYKILE